MNQLSARIHQVETDGNISLVELYAEELIFSVLVIDTPDTANYLKAGLALTMVFKEIEVSLGKNLSGSISFSNQIPVKITSLSNGKVLTKVNLSFKGNSLSSVITTRSAQELNLQIGEEVMAFVKATDITLVQD